MTKTRRVRQVIQLVTQDKRAKWPKLRLCEHHQPRVGLDVQFKGGFLVRGIIL